MTDTLRDLRADTARKMARQSELITSYSSATARAKTLAKMKAFDAAIDELSPLTVPLSEDKSDYVLLSRALTCNLEIAKYLYSAGRRDDAWRKLNETLTLCPEQPSYRVKVHEAMASQLRKEKKPLDAALHCLWVQLYKIKALHKNRNSALEFGYEGRAAESLRTAYRLCGLDEIAKTLKRCRVGELSPEKIESVQHILIDIAQNHLGSLDTGNAERRLREALKG